jgi:uncharacterized Zn finger protein
MSYWSGAFFAPRKSVAERRADAAREMKAAARRGQAMSPVAVTGRKIAHTFWGQAWCDNLERYRDYAYRLERGRSYVRSGSVIHLEIGAGKVSAKVHGSSLYEVAITIDEVKRDHWRAIQRDCAGGIGSRIDLLSGRLSEPVMARLCVEHKGLFPAPAAIRFTCSCPDYAVMCKHVAAAMYGIGARLDQAPELLFTLRQVSVDELLASAVTELPAAPSAARVLANDGLAALFGIELAEAPAGASKPSSPRRSRRLAPSTPASATRAAAKPARPATRSVRSTSATAPAAHPTKPPTSRARLSAAKVSAPVAPPAKPSASRGKPSAAATLSASGAPPPKPASRAKPAAMATLPGPAAKPPAARAKPRLSASSAPAAQRVTSRVKPPTMVTLPTSAAPPKPGRRAAPPWTKPAKSSAARSRSPA